MQKDLGGYRPAGELTRLLIAGMTTEEMRNCLVGGGVETAKIRVAHLKHFLRTFVGNVHVRLDRPTSIPVICKFVDADSAAICA